MRNRAQSLNTELLTEARSCVPKEIGSPANYFFSEGPRQDARGGGEGGREGLGGLEEAPEEGRVPHDDVQQRRGRRPVGMGVLAQRGGHKGVGG